MAKENKGIFREKSLDRISSPDQLNDYIKVSNVGIWMIFAGLIIFLIGVIVWGSFGHIDSYNQAMASVKDGKAVIYMPISSDDMDDKVTYNTVSILGKKYNVEAVRGDNDTTGAALEPINLTKETIANMPTALVNSGYYKEDTFMYLIDCTADVQDGVYKAKVVKSSYRPMDLIFSNNEE